MLSRQTSANLVERPPDRRPRDAGCPTLRVELDRHTVRMYDRRHGSWRVPLAVVGDVIGAAEFQQGRSVAVVKAAR